MRVVRVLVYRSRQLLHGAANLLQRARLKGCARGQLAVAGGDVAGGAEDLVRAIAHLGHNRDQAFTHVLQRVLQLADLVRGVDHDVLRQVTRGNIARYLHAAFQRCRHHLVDERVDQDQHRNAGDDGGQY